MNRYLHYILTSCFLFGLTACESEVQMEESNMQPLRIRAELPSSGFTRATVGDDGFSVRAFGDGDEAGFFSESNGASAGFDNAKMTFEKGYFTGLTADINRLGRTLLYYPYNAVENGRQPIRQANGEVIDLLYSTTIGNVDAGSLVATFNHTFSMFIIDGGLGFQNINDPEKRPEITVTMEKPLETVEFQRAPQDEVGYKVVFNGKHTEGGTEPDKGLATFKGHYNDKDGKYYIILPNDGVTKVKSIDVKDDGGKMHHIKWTQGWLAYGTKYPVTLKLDEGVPVINIHDITPWGGHTELKTDQEVGIGSASAFKEWMEAYNSTDPKETELLKYGNKIEIVSPDETPTGEYYWHFLLSADIDFSTETFLNDASIVIKNLNGVLDGCGHTLSGISLKGTNCALIGEIDGEYACVKNLTVENLTLTTEETENSVGALAMTFKSGSVENCSFPNLLIDAKSPAGVIAGTIGSGVKIKNCNASGSIFATETKDKVIGSGELSNEQKKGCDVTNVMFGQQ